MLEEVVKSVFEESSSSVKLQLLSAVMKMFFKRPPECQEMLGTLLEHSIGKSVDTFGRVVCTLLYLAGTLDSVLINGCPYRGGFTVYYSSG